ncbi:MAG: amidase, partial [Chloroflexi bacterium]|nr:amidase [Chloroflexota bacterium]
SGSAVGAAVGMFPAALGSQTGGSIVRPSSYNGIVGLKPTFGRVSRYGVYPVSESLDTMGPMVRSVGDAALMLNVLAGHDIDDADSSERPVEDYLQAAQSKIKPPRIGLLRQFFMEQCDDETRANTESVAAMLEEAGATVEEVTLPANFDEALRAQRTLMSVEASQVHEDNFAVRADDFSANVHGLVEQGMGTPALTYLKAKHFQREFARGVQAGMTGFDALLMPTTPAPAPPSRETTGDPKFQSPWTLGGFPEITLPSGLSESGMPLGAQLVAGHFEEARLLAVAAWCEEVIGVRLTPMAP